MHNQENVVQKKADFPMGQEHLNQIVYKPTRKPITFSAPAVLIMLLLTLLASFMLLIVLKYKKELNSINFELASTRVTKNEHVEKLQFQTEQYKKLESEHLNLQNYLTKSNLPVVFSPPKSTVLDWLDSKSRQLIKEISSRNIYLKKQFLDRHGDLVTAGCSGYQFQSKYVITSKHCLMLGHKSPLTISGKTVHFYHSDPLLDLSLLASKDLQSVPHTALFGGELKIDQVVFVVGNPNNIIGQTMLASIVNPLTGTDEFTIRGGTVFGNSGGAVIDAETGSLIGVIKSLTFSTGENVCVRSTRFIGESITAIQQNPKINLEDFK